jgi:pimeloyl-ACP methyl ester carboxylesterase
LHGAHDAVILRFMTLSWPTFTGSTTFHARPPDAPLPSAPTDAGAALRGEWRTLVRLPLLLTRAWPLAQITRGDGSIVIDTPGWKAPETSMAPLRIFLRRKGHDARGWGLGTNRGRPEKYTILLTSSIEAIVAKAGQPVTLIGWSLGGVVARAIPHAVRRVITFGTPVVGGPTHTLAARAFGSKECARITALADTLDRTRPNATDHDADLGHLLACRSCRELARVP